MGTNEKQAKANVEVINGFQVPKWAAKPPSGLHLDVMKDGKMIQKLMIDEKKCYFFGRNKDVCDFVIDHASCSRVHAVLLWHKDLNRSFIVDMNSTHGTFIGSLRLEGNKPQQVFVDNELKFGASTRTYIVREKPQMSKHAINPSSILNTSGGDSINESGTEKEDSFSLLTSLPESETELDNLTEFNTAHNKRIAQLVDITTTSTTNPIANQVKGKRKSVVFNEEEEVINPEDIDPSIGRFRNLVQTTIVIPNKKKKVDNNQPTGAIASLMASKPGSSILSLYNDDENYDDDRRAHRDHNMDTDSRFGLSNSIISNLGVRTLDIAPDVDEDYHSVVEKRPQTTSSAEHSFEYETSSTGQQTDRKKKYAKEAWPGRHPSAQIPSAPLTLSVASTNVTSAPPVLASLIAPTTSLPTLAPSSSSASTTTKRLVI